MIGIWERGENIPKLRALLLLTRVFGLGSVEELLGETLGSGQLIAAHSTVANSDTRGIRTRASTPGGARAVEDR